MGRIEITRHFSISAFCGSHDFYWDSDYVYEGESHESWEVVYVVSGAVEVTEDSQIYHLTEGNMILHAPLEFHNIRSADYTSPHVLVFSFIGEGELPLKLREGVFALSAQERSAYEELFCRISFLWEDTEKQYAGQECADQLSAFLVRLSENHAAKEQIVYTRDTQIYKKLIDVMEQNLHRNRTLAEIADMVPVSVSYMKVLFERYAGVSPKNYYNRLRCTEAIKMLQEGYTVVETSDKLMFSSPNYFSRFFSRMTGMPPATYIRGHYLDSDNKKSGGEIHEPKA